MNPFDLSGPEFLGLYCVALVFAVLLSLILKEWARSPSDPLDDRTLDSLHPYEVAFLRAGAEGAVQAAIAMLMHRGRIEVDDYELALVEGTGGGRELVADGVYRGVRRPAPEHPLDQCILGELEGVGGRADYDRVAAACRVTARRLGDRIARLELYRPSLGARNLVLGLPLCAVLLLGIGKVGVGIVRGRPVLFLVGLVVFTLVTLVAVRLKEHRTRRGEAALETLTKRNAALRDTAKEAPQQLTDDETGLATALFGAAALGGSLAVIHALLPTPMPSVSSASSSVSSCGASCGSSCGSSCGGGCGGGCGGCGG